MIPTKGKTKKQIIEDGWKILQEKGFAKRDINDLSGIDLKQHADDVREDILMGAFE